MLFGIFGIILLSACSSSTGTDFKEAQWGMTLDEVVKLEEKAGNKHYDEGTDLGGIQVEFEGMIIDGLKADVEYVFKDEVDKFDFGSTIGYEAKNEEEAVALYQELPDTMKLDDFLLVEGNYFFQDIDDAESKTILEKLTKKYGKPLVVQDDTYWWSSKRAEIYFDGKDYVSYNAGYSALKKYMKSNTGAGGKL